MVSRGRFWLAAVPMALAAAGTWIYRRRTIERISSHESLDDPSIAEAFNRVARWPQMRLLRWYAARRAIAMKTQGEAADLGCGPGDLVVGLAARAPGLHVTGVDLSDEMLAEAERFSAGTCVASRVSFRKGDVARIPFPDGSLDLVVSTLSLHHWEDPVPVLNEIGRVLRPGGSFLVFDLRRDLSPPFYLLLWLVTRLIVPKTLRRINEPLASRDAAYTPGEAAGLARRPW
ncbi:MAG: class I SAM-dependent methyltransferase [Chloroflexota bacterium]|nr:class I SAM-dependent methyltransferase [Chloroflexota bacterium]